MRSITLNVNGNRHTVDVEPATPLLYILRNDLGLQGPRFGCGLGQPFTWAKPIADRAPARHSAS
jgi:nicotinate dehydrogenase subunit A